MDQIATVQIIVEQSTVWQFSLYINFIDFEKAFNSISRDVLWRVLYEGFSAQVVHNGQNDRTDH